MENRDVIFAKWLTGEISDDELLSQHGAEALADLKLIKSASDRLYMPKYDTTKGLEKFKVNYPSKVAKVRKINWSWIGGIAASFLVLVFCWSQFWTDQNQILKAGNGLHEYLALDDGSEIRLNDGSAISYNLGEWSSARNISLTGEAFFQVSKGSPFKVQTTNGVIEVLGTEFNVRAWGDKLYVECYEGRVQVKANNQQTILSANESVNIIQGQMESNLTINHDSPIWNSGTSRFYDENINEVFNELERQYKINVSVSLLNQSFSGSFSHSNLEDALKSICIPLGLAYRISDDQKEVFIQ